MPLKHGGIALDANLGSLRSVCRLGLTEAGTPMAKAGGGGGENRLLAHASMMPVRLRRCQVAKFDTVVKVGLCQIDRGLHGKIRHASLRLLSIGGAFAFDQKDRFESFNS
jgi:hypothetical protein